MKDRDKNHRKPLFIWIASAFTAVWVVVAIAYVVWDWSEFSTMKPNEYGDFFAGAFALPAFGWLILGYFLQSRELGLQIEELRHQVEATTKIAESTVESARRETLEIQPQFVIQSVDRGSQNVLQIWNVADKGTGRTATHVHLERFEGSLKLEPWSAPSMGPDAIGLIVFSNRGPGRFEITYTDSRSERRSVWFSFSGNLHDSAKQEGKPQKIEP